MSDNLLERARTVHFPFGNFNEGLNHQTDLLEFLLPVKLNQGRYRSVYRLNHPKMLNDFIPFDVRCNTPKYLDHYNNSSLVLKVAHQYEGSILSGIESNINEWNLSCRTGCDKYMAAKMWLAPVIKISECGRYLIQVETQPLADELEMPVMVPDFLNDTHWKNFGWLTDIDGIRRAVCHDYGDAKNVSMLSQVVNLIDHT